jgi:hypothetical protein
LPEVGNVEADSVLAIQGIHVAQTLILKRGGNGENKKAKKHPVNLEMKLVRISLMILVTIFPLLWPVEPFSREMEEGE